LQYGTGSEARIETRGVTVTVAGGVTNRTEVDDIRYVGAGNAAYHATETYQMFPWGFELVETQVPDSGSGGYLTTLMEYYSDTNDPADFGQLKDIVYPDGYWEARINGAEGITVLKPNLDLPGSPGDALSNPNSAVNEYHYLWQWGADDVTATFQPPNSAIVTNRLEFDGNLPDGLGFNESSDVLQGGIKLWDTGTTTYTMDDSWDYGLAQHEITVYTPTGAGQSCYYNGGTYDPVGKVFTVSTNAIWMGPDWRKSTIFSGVDEVLGFNVFPFLYVAEGQPLYQPGHDLSPTYVNTNQGWKQTEIYSQGSLVQKERYVIIGSEDTDTNNPICDIIDKSAYQNDSLGHVTNITWIDPVTSVSRVMYSADYKGGNANDGDLKLWEEDQYGVQTTYTYDSLKRVIATTKGGVSASGGFAAQAPVTNSFTYDAQNRVLSQSRASSGLSLTSYTNYDVAGRVTQQIETNGLITSNTYSLGGRVVSTILPSGANQVVTNYLDRRVKSKTGSGLVNEYHDWQYLSDSYNPFVSTQWEGSVAHQVQYGYSGSPRSHLQCVNWLNQVTADQSPDWSLTNVVEAQYIPDAAYTGNIGGVRRVTLDPNNETITLYDSQGNTNSVETLSGGSLPGDLSNRRTYSWHGFEKDSGAWFEVQTNWVYAVNGSEALTMTNTTRSQLNGFTSGATLSVVTTLDANSNATVVTTTVDRSTAKVTQTTGIASSILPGVRVSINGLLQSLSTPSVAAATVFSYDALGRLVQTTDPLGFRTTQSYNGSGQPASSTDASGLTTSYTYCGNGMNGAGMVSSKCVGGKYTYYSYTNLGNLYRSWGDVPYPQEMVYDANYGDLTELHTFRGGSGWTSSTWPASPGTADVTKWTYQEATGLLTNKTDASGHSVSYTYWQGLETTRTWARLNGTNTMTRTSYYNLLGELSGCAYNDGTPPVAITNQDRRGLPTEIDDASGTNQLAYDTEGRMTSSAWTGGLFAGITISNHYDRVRGRDILKATGLSPALETDYGYDTYGRMNTVASGGNSAGYAYLPNSDLLQTTTSSNGSGPVLTTTRQWDYGFRLRSIANTVSGATVTSHNYTYDNLNRRTRATLEDGSMWNYAYNNRNELTGAARFWSDWSPVTGQQYGYGFDNIGNRTSAQVGSVGNMPASTYAVNGLNEYTNIVTPGYKDILGVAIATNTVTVNGGLADRKVEYFHKQITITNSSGPLWQNVGISAGGTTNGGLVFPANSQSLTYDADGNLTFDGIWTYQWDGENRLLSMSMTNISGIAASNRLRLDFAYDFMNRRISKMVSTNSTGSTFVPQSTNYFIYDGWNLIAAFGPATNIQQSFVWGLDLSRTMTGACGVGGLLAIVYSGTNYYASYDGNGNITGLINGVDKTTSARYEYSPFGEIIRVTGPVAKVSPFRFATKFCDVESGLVYYGWRYYSPTLGKWLGREPSTDQQVWNLYLFCHNNAINRFDIDGRTDWAMVMEGLANITAGGAGAFVIGASAVPTGGASMLLGFSALMGCTLEVGIGLGEVFDGLMTEGSVSSNRKLYWNAPTSMGGVFGRMFGGQQGQAIGNYLEATAGTIEAARIGGSLLQAVFSLEAAKTLVEWDVSGYEMSEAEAGGDND